MQLNSQSEIDLFIMRNFTTTLNLILLVNADKNLQTESSAIDKKSLGGLGQCLKEYIKEENVKLKRMTRRMRDSKMRIDDAHERLKNQ